MTRRRARRILNLIWWWGLGVLMLAIVGGYFGSALVRDVYPPYVPTEGTSMKPLLHEGDLVILKHATVDKLKKGDIIAFQTTKTVQQKYGVPSHYVHMIYRVVHEPGGQLEFQTKGIDNPTPDGFLTPASLVIGEYAGVVPDVGYIVLFVQSKEGLVLGAAIVAIIAIYILLGYLDERKAEREQLTVDFARALSDMREMVDDVVEAVTPPQRPLSRSPASSVEEREQLGRTAPMLPAGPPAMSATTSAATTSMGEPGSPAGPFGAHEDGTSQGLVPGGRPRADDRLDVLVGVVSEYGEHLKSHTAVMQHLAVTTDRLESATNGLLLAVGELRSDGRHPESALVGRVQVPTRVLFDRAAARLDALDEAWEELRARIARLERLLAGAHVIRGDRTDDLSGRLVDGPSALACPPLSRTELPPVWEVAPLPRG